MNVEAAQRERAVLAETIEWFRADESRFYPGMYLGDARGRILHQPGRNVATTCAIGGVEQAVWRLLDRNVKGERIPLAYVVDEAAAAAALAGSEADEAVFAYARVMGRLNRLARSMYDVACVEAVAMGVAHDVDDDDVNRERMLAVMEAALTELDLMLWEHEQGIPLWAGAGAPC